MTAYLSLFTIAFIAATVFPAQSEAVLVGLMMSGHYSVVGLLIVATVGNVLGAVLNYYMGVGIDRFKDRKWFPANEKQMERAKRWYEKYGRWSLLLSWLPIIGDALTVTAGVMRERLWIFIGIVTISKASRYLFIAAIALNWVKK